MLSLLHQSGQGLLNIMEGIGLCCSRYGLQKPIQLHNHLPKILTLSFPLLLILQPHFEHLICINFLQTVLPIRMLFIQVQATNNRDKVLVNHIFCFSLDSRRITHRLFYIVFEHFCWGIILQEAEYVVDLCFF